MENSLLPSIKPSHNCKILSINLCCNRPANLGDIKPIAGILFVPVLIDNVRHFDQPGRCP